MKFVAFVLMVVGTAMTSTLSVAQDNRSTEPNATSPKANRIDDKVRGMNVRASKLIGMRIYNSQNENVGTVQDLVLNPTTNRIEYMAVTYGGFLGLGDKWFAVPVEAVRYVPDTSNNGQIRLHMDVSKERMQGAQGFDENNWPNFSDSQFTSELYKRYNVERRRDERDTDLDVNIGRDGVDINVDRDRK